MNPSSQDRTRIGRPLRSGRGAFIAAARMEAKLAVTYAPPLAFTTLDDARRAWRRADRWRAANPGKPAKDMPRHIRTRAVEARDFLKQQAES